MIGVGDRDQRSGAFANGPTAQFGDAPLGDHFVDGVLQRRDHVARRELRHDLRDRPLLRGGVQHDEPLTADRVHRAAGKVGLPAARRVVRPCDGFGRALPDEIDGDRGVDRDELGFLGDHAGIVDISHRPQFEGRVLVQEVVQPLGSQGERADGLGAIQLLGHARDNATLDEFHHTVGDQLGVDAEITMIDEGREDRVRYPADPDLDRRAVRDAFGDQRSDLEVGRTDSGRCDLVQRIIGLGPSHHLTDVHLVATERPRHLLVRLEEEPRAPDERGDVVGVQTKAEVAVPVWRRCRSKHQWIVGRALQDGAHLREVVRDEIDGVGLVARPSDVREEVRHMTQPIAVGAVQVRTIAQHMHLMHPHPRQLLGFAFDRIEQRDRLAVGQRDDDVASRVEVIQHCFSG